MNLDAVAMNPEPITLNFDTVTMSIEPVNMSLKPSTMYFETCWFNHFSPQASVLAHTYIQNIGEKRFKPSAIGTFGHVAIGLYPDDMDDLMKTEDDVLDLADELKDIEEDLTSGQVSLYNLNVRSAATMTLFG